MSEVALRDISNQLENAQISKTDDKELPISKSDGKDLNISEPEKILKHPLENAWTLWFFKNVKSQTWEESQRQVITVTTVEDFWALYNHIDTTSCLPPASDYSLFKEGITPDWEHHRNKDGGRWIINLDRRFREAKLDDHWLDVMLFLIGEHGDQYAHLVNGAVVNVRNKGDKIAIWLSGQTAEEGVLQVGHMIKNRLALKDKIGFNVHKEDKSRPSSIARPKYYV